MVSQQDQPPADKNARSEGHKKPRHKGRGKNPARRVAANMLAAILRGKTLDEARDKLSDLKDGDRNLADAMVQTALRHYGTLEKLLKTYVKKMPPRAAPARALLFIGAAQLVHMNIPAHAAIDETVAATGRREQPYRGMINAVLRNIARAQEAGTLPVFDAVDNIPDWLRDNWQAAYGAEKLAALADGLAATPPLELCFKTEQMANAWLRENSGTAVSSTHIRLPETGDITKLPGFAAGDFWVQNHAAGRPAQMLANVLAPGALVLDICAAPGGKTLQLAAAGMAVTALDISANRLKRLRDNLKRTDLSADIVCADALDWLPISGPQTKTEQQFDAILLDAPCTATGTLRRHPDLLIHRHEGDMVKLMELQKALLATAAPRVKQGGFLLYGVCAMQPQEGADQIEAFLQTHTAFQLRGSYTCLPLGTPNGARDSEAGTDGDGFYAALLHKTTESYE